MSILNLQASYFSIANPLRILDRWRHGYCHCRTLLLQGRPLELRWSARAERELRKLRQPLVIELQLYFSCVVKKRVLFHQQVDFATTRVDERLEIAFRPIASAACNPDEFARDYPAGRELSQGPAARMVPSVAEIDYRAGQWEGRFRYR